MKSKLAVKILEREGESIYFDPITQGRTLKVFGIDNDPWSVVEHLSREYKKIGYDSIIFDTRGIVEGQFENVVSIEDGKELGLDPINLWKEGLIKDPYTATTIIQTIYELDSTSTKRLYSDIILGKIKSMKEVIKSEKSYAEVIKESYTELDEIFYSGEPPKLEGGVLIDFKKANSIDTVGAAFLILATIIERRREVFVGICDTTVLAYTAPGYAALPLLTQPARRRVTALGTNYVFERTSSIPGPVLMLYNDPDIQSMVYETNGVPPGEMRKHVLKGEGILIWRTPETINVEWGELPF